MRRPSTVVLAVSVIMAMAVPSALADGGGKPLDHVVVNDRFVLDPDTGVLDLCGVEVTTEFHLWGHFTLFADNTFRSHDNVEVISTDPATGDVLLVERRAMNRFSEPEVQIVDEQSLTSTFIYEDTWRGATGKYQIPGEGVIMLNAGTYTLIQTVVIDLVTGGVISHDLSYTDVHGPHPSLTQSESDWLEMFCGAMGA